MELEMANYYGIICFLVFCSSVRMDEASPGDSDPLYRLCVRKCEKIGSVGERYFTSCKFSSDDSSLWYMQNPLYICPNEWDCKSECRYHCMMHREKVRAEVGQRPVKYHGKWPFKRLFGLQEPASVIFSALNLIVHFCGMLSFRTLVCYKLPVKSDKTPFYDYTVLCIIHGFLSVNSCFWSAVFHSRDMEWTELVDYSSAVALLGYSLMFAIIRSFSLRDEATRVMIAAPLLAFTTTHILYLNNYNLDYGWNMRVCVIMAVAQLLTWSIWAGVTRHPSRWKLWIVVFGVGLVMLLEIFEFPPFLRFLDAHALWHASTIPLTHIWWSFIKDDAEYRTSTLLNKVKF